jgi:hypothetical protein
MPSLLSAQFITFEVTSVSNIVAHRPVARQRLEINNETTAVAMQRLAKHASATTELLLETVFCTRSVQKGYKKGNWVTKLVESCGD